MQKEVLMNEIKELLGLKECKIKIIKISEQLINKEKIKVITIIGTVKKAKCPICKKYTYNIHDKLKPKRIKYLQTSYKQKKNFLIKIN